MDLSLDISNLGIFFSAKSLNMLQLMITEARPFSVMDPHT